MNTRQTSSWCRASTKSAMTPDVHRRHPVSIAVSMALLAAAATSAMAAERTAAPADNAELQDSAQQQGPTTPPPEAKKAKSGTSGPGADEGATESQLQTVTVTGVRVSQERAIELKRLAPSIQDSISA